MAKVMGIGGVFFKSKDAAARRKWYADVLGVEMSEWGGFFTTEAMAAHPGAGTVFSPFNEDTSYFEPSTERFMINLAVDDLDGVIARCREHGVDLKILPDEPNGRFAHLIDPEGLKIELWEPKPFDQA